MVQAIIFAFVLCCEKCCGLIHDFESYARSHILIPLTVTPASLSACTRSRSQRWSGNIIINFMCLLKHGTSCLSTCIVIDELPLTIHRSDKEEVVTSQFSPSCSRIFWNRVTSPTSFSASANTLRESVRVFSLTFMSLLRGLPKTSSESRSFTSASRTSTTCWTSLIVTRCGIARFPLSRTRIPPAQEKALPSIWRGSKGHLEQVLHEWDVFAQDYIGKCCMSEMILLKITRWSGWCWEDSVWSSQFWHSRSGDTHERVPFLLQQSFGLLRGGWKADPRQELAFCIS